MEFAKIFDDLTFLNFNNVVLNLITSFPWDALRLKLSNSNFITFSVKNAFDYSIIIIRRIYYDNGTDAVTIPHLFTKIVNASTQKKNRDRIKEIKNALKLHEKPINHFVIKY